LAITEPANQRIVETAPTAHDTRRNMTIGYAIHVFVCENERADDHPRGCCTARGSNLIRAWFKDSLCRHGISEGNRVNGTSCLDFCEVGPTIVVYPEGVWYSPKTRDDVEEIVTRHFLTGEVVERLRLR
jgi:(2Fe-2S) ferredoxin